MSDDVTEQPTGDTLDLLGITPTQADHDRALAYGRSVATRRAALGLSVAQLAELLGASPAKIESIEAGASPDLYLRLWIAGILGADLFPHGGGTAVAELDAHAADLGCWEPHAPMVAWARRLYDLDHRITWQAQAHLRPRRSHTQQSAPEPDEALVPGPALAPVELPALESPGRRPASDREWLTGDDSGIDYPADGRVLAQLLRDHLGIAHDVPLDPTAVAARFGVQVADAPANAGSWVKGILLRPAGTALIVTNSRMNPVVTRFSIAHLLGHLLAGDVVALAVTDRVEDQDDDSIYCCTGAGPDTCWRADAFATELLVPAAYLSTVRDWDPDTPRAGGQLWWHLGTIQRLADDLGVDTHVVAGYAGDLGLIEEDAMETVRVALRRRSPFGGTARNGGRDATHSEDLALPEGDGAHRMPARLRARAVAAWDSEIAFHPAHELFEDADFTDADRARVHAQQQKRDADRDTWSREQTAQTLEDLLTDSPQ